MFSSHLKFAAICLCADISNNKAFKIAMYFLRTKHKSFCAAAFNIYENESSRKKIVVV